MRKTTRVVLGLLGTLAMLFTMLAPTALAHPDDGGSDDAAHLEAPGDPSAALAAHDAAAANVVSSGPFADVTKNIEARGRGVRDVPNATTDVWALNGYAYTGTFNSPCGGEEGGGVHIWDVSNPNMVSFVDIIDSPVGSRSNDVRVATMGTGDILVHSNESCGGGPGGFEVYNVDDPANPVPLASVRIDDPNPLTPFIFGSITDVGVHNLWLFSQGETDYVGVTTETAYGNFHIYDITDPSNPVLVSFWGAEESFDPGVVASGDFGRNLNAAIWLTSGFGASANRFLHDVTITEDGMHAYLANWDAGLILLDISNPAEPQLVSVAIDPTSEDGEVNSHSVWPSEDGTIVVEGEEDFSPFSTAFNVTSGPGAGAYEAFELGFTTPIASLPGQEMSGPTTYVGLACDASDPVPSGSDIALVLRGACRFDEKATNVINAGYSGMVVFTASPGDAPFAGGGNPRAIPGVMVGNETGLLIAGVASMADLALGAAGESVAATTEPNGWSGFRIWDYSDPANPILASTFNTVCSANPNDPSCDPAGTYSSHNVQVETLGNQVKAYISWYSDGMLILDVSDPYNPVEIGRYTEEGTDFWGVYKEKNSPFFYGSDRNGGLYVFKEQGAGSG